MCHSGWERVGVELGWDQVGAYGKLVGAYGILPMGGRRRGGHGTGDTGVPPAHGALGSSVCVTRLSVSSPHKVGILKQVIGPALQGSPWISTMALGWGWAAVMGKGGSGVGPEDHFPARSLNV